MSGSKRRPSLLVISYSREDASIVAPLAKLLKASGLEVFFDSEDLTYGDNWRQQIRKTVGLADRFLLFWSREAARSKWVQEEWKIAYQNPNCHIVPILLDKTPLPKELGEIHGASELQPIVHALRRGRRNRRILVTATGMLGVLLSIFSFTFTYGPIDVFASFLFALSLGALIVLAITSPIWAVPLAISWYKTKRLRDKFVENHYQVYSET